MGVGDLIEHPERRLGGLGQAVADFIYVDCRQRLGQQRQALMDGARRQQAGEDLAVDRLQSRERACGRAFASCSRAPWLAAASAVWSRRCGRRRALRSAASTGWTPNSQ